MNLFLSSSGGSAIDRFYVPVNNGFELLQTAWNIMHNTKFELQGVPGEISMAQIMIACLFLELAGFLLYKFFWGE